MPNSMKITNMPMSNNLKLSAASQIFNCRKKQQVASQFSRAASSYDQAARIQHFSVMELIGQLENLQVNNPQYADNAYSGSWLDLGCGTGFAVPELCHLGAKQVVGADLAHAMCEVSRDKLTNLPFHAVNCDAENLPFADNSFDGIFSNLMIQWSEDLDALFYQAHRVLKPGALFAFSTLGPNTMHELKAAWQKVDPYVHVNQFNPPEVLIEQCERFFDIESFHQQACIQQHAGLSPLLKELKDIGATNVNPGRRPGLGGRERLRLLEQAYQQISGETLSLTYDLIWVIARKI